MPGLLMTIDFEKAFDSLEWTFLLKTLETFNFGPDFISWIRAIYTNITSCVMNNGYGSKYFKLGRGVRQGDPISAYLFILALEPLAHYIRQNEEIRGIKVCNNEIKLSLFADDITSYLKDEHSARVLFRALQDFKSASGLNVNSDKTELLWLGCQRNSNRKVLGITPQIW